MGRRAKSLVRRDEICVAPRRLASGLLPGVLLLACAFLAIRPIGDPDCWFHMAFGRCVLQTGALPRTDPFSYTAGQREWISSGWASSIVLELLFRAMGTAGPTLLAFALIAAALLAVYLSAARTPHSAGGVAVLLLLGMLASYLRYSPRPDAWSQLLAALLAVLLAAVVRDDQLVRPRRLWLLVPLVLLWANVHVGFIAGLELVLICALWLAVRWVRIRDTQYLRALAPCVASCFVWLANPYSWRIVALVAKNSEIPGENLRNMEWMPLVFLPPGGATLARFLELNLPLLSIGAAVLLFVAVLAVLWLNRGCVGWWQWAAVLLFIAHAVYQRRQLGLAAVVLPALAAPHLAALEARAGQWRRWLPAVALALAVILCGLRAGGALAMPSGLPRFGTEERMLPVHATRFMKHNPPPANVYNTYYIGGYLLYWLFPDVKVFYDGRLDVFGPETWNTYWAIEEGRMPMDDAVKRFGLNTAILDTRAAMTQPMHLANRFSAGDAWRLVYFDDYYSVLVRQTPANADYLARHGFEYLSAFAQAKLAKALRNPKDHPRLGAEVERALRISAGSGIAHAMASAYAQACGDAAGARRHAEEAQRRDPSLGIGSTGH